MNISVLTLFKSTPGACSVVEGLALSQLAATAPDGIWIESGTAYGKSAVATACGISRSAQFNLIDPLFSELDNDHTRQVLLRVFEAGGDRVKPVVFSFCSDLALPKIISLSNTPIAWVFLDSGEHTEELVSMELSWVVPCMAQGGIIAFHDYQSQFVGVERCYNELLATGEFEEIAIPWDQHLEWLRANDTPEPNDSWHHPELANPMFLGALRKL